jgi:hypothetical protein
MRNSILLLCLLLSGCGFEYKQEAFLNKAQEKYLLAQPYGTAYADKIGKIFVLGSKQYILDVLKQMAKDNNHTYELIWDRHIAYVEYTADALYKLKIHPGHSSKVNENYLETLETYALIEFESPEVVSEAFKKQIFEAFRKEQLKHHPHEHINAVAKVNKRAAVVKEQLGKLFTKLYPMASQKTIMIDGKSYTIVSIPRETMSGVSTSDQIYYAVSDVEKSNISEIQLHTSKLSISDMGNVLEIHQKEKSQALLDTVVEKIGK